MPSMADITIKKADGTTDVVYSQLSPAGGDGVMAQWRANAVSTVAAFRQVFGMVTRWNGKRDARRFETHFKMPITQVDAASGITTVIGYIPIDCSGVIPVTAPDSLVQEAIYQNGNLLCSALIRSAAVSGYAPT